MFKHFGFLEAPSMLFKHCLVKPISHWRNCLYGCTHTQENTGQWEEPCALLGNWFVGKVFEDLLGAEIACLKSHINLSTATAFLHL